MLSRAKQHHIRLVISWQDIGRNNTMITVNGRITTIIIHNGR
jgi:hypothetical protein